MTNGQLDVSTLVQAANGAPGQVLERNTAAAWAGMVLAASAAGIHLAPEPDDGIPSCYRDLAHQNYAWDQYKNHGGNLAAVPGTSNHGFGTAIDINVSDTRVKVWLDANAARFSFSWNEGRASGEPWHWVFIGGGTAVVGFSQAVANEQNWLNAKRGEHLVVDGLAGPLFAAAVSRYETFLRDYGYTGAIDGIWGPGVQAAHAKYYAVATAAPAPAPSGRPTIKLGASGQIVKDLQYRLNRDYPAYSHLVVDGQFGPATDAVVRNFQSRAGLTVDGIVGPATWSKLGL